MPEGKELYRRNIFLSYWNEDNKLEVCSDNLIIKIRK